MLKYIRIRRKNTDQHNLFTSFVISLSLFAELDAFALPSMLVLSDESSQVDGDAFCISAPYPAFSTALIISAALAVPSTPIEFVKRLTAQDVTPGTFVTAFSTRAEQAAHDSYIIFFHSVYLIIFWIVSTSSSTTSDFPFFMSSTTQVRIWFARRTLLNELRAEVTADA